jgi:hypothetical protein
MIGAVLLATGLVSAPGLFAQEIKFDGYVNTGLGVVHSSEDNAPAPFIAAAGVDSMQNAFRIRLNATYTNEAGNAGALLRLQASGGYNHLTIPVAYGWFSVFNSILTVKGGIVDDGVFHTPGAAYLALDQGEGLGAFVTIAPISGLDIGVGAYLKETAFESQQNQSINNGTPDTLPGSTIPGSWYFKRDLDDVKYTFNLAYTLPDAARFVASFRTKSEASSTGAPLSSRLNASVSLLAVPNLKAILELQLDNLQNFKTMHNGDEDAWNRTVGTSPGVTPVSASGKINIYETIQYDAGNLSAGLWAVQWLSQAENTDLALYINPWVSYTIGSIVPRLDLGYGSGAQANFNNSNLNWHRINFGIPSNTYNSDYSVISIRPSVKFNINSKTFVELGDLIDIDGGPKGFILHDADATTRISNVFYIDFKWSF